ncbi:MAG: O-antigen ligase family protein [Pseudomonadota bacterium]
MIPKYPGQNLKCNPKKIKAIAYITMRISIKHLIDWSLVVIFYAGFQGGKYFFNNRVQELGIVLTLMLFLYTATQVAMSKKAVHWQRWFWSSPLLIVYIMGSSAAVFSVYAQTPLLPSFFAAREFLILLLAPALYFLYHLGYPIKRIEKVFIFSLVIVLVNYVFHYFRVDLVAAYFSEGYMSYLVTYDEWRGYRLKAPTFALIIATLYAGFRLFQQDKLSNKIYMILLLCLSFYIWYLLKARSQMATIILALLCYPLFFIRPNRISLLLVFSPIAIFLILALGGVLADFFLNSEGGGIRASSYAQAWENIKNYPLFGYGQSSGYSKTYQDIFGAKFFPSDLGIIGIIFKYGFSGVMLYVFFNFYLFRKLMRTNWIFYCCNKQTNPVIWALFIFFTALSINIVLNPGLAYMQGLTIAAFTIALTACYRDEMDVG